MMLNCDRCGKLAPTLTVIVTAEATFWSPSETAEWCDECLEETSAERMDSLRDAALEQQWEARMGF